MRRGLLKCFIIAVAFVAIFYISVTFPNKASVDESPKFRTNSDIIEINNEGEWQKFKIKGINMGTGYPTLFPNEYGITEDTYYHWFELIGQMNANTLRVYKLQSPAFYKAFYKYNENRAEPLYLIQTVDFPEKMMHDENNVLDEKGVKSLLKETKQLVRAIHGDEIILDAQNDSMFVYNYDVSRYVLGYALGIEWDELYVEYINRINPNIKSFKGEFLYCDDGSPFECFLASWGDFLMKYENDRYNEQKLISFCNWPDTDPFKNEFKISNENINAQEYLEVFVDADKIKMNDNVKTGIFVSYNVYPYFPTFLQQSEYCDYIDENGKNNPYRKYLMELNEHHEYPVVVSEFGIPSSRNAAYLEMYNGFSHGGLNEKEQGEALKKLYNDINKSGCAGSLVFTWQDEWYKTAWNEKYISNPDKRAFWSNAMSAEQAFGVLAFEPGEEGKTVYPDGDFSDWTQKDIISHTGNQTLSMKYDERYVYIMAEGLDKRKGHSLINIALDVLPNAGQIKDIEKDFKKPVDFIIRIDDEKHGALFVDKESDIFELSALGSYLHMNINNIKYSVKLENKSTLKMDNESNFTVVTRAQGSIKNFIKGTLKADEVGILKSGNANPNSKSFYSNADFFVKGDRIEIRIPWQLLNFTDPSNSTIVSGIDEGGFKAKEKKINKIYASAYFDDETDIEDFGKLKLKGWTKPVFFERLKDSYYILQDVFKEVNVK